MKREYVKHLIALKLIDAGYHTFTEVAARLGITFQYVSLIVLCREKPARWQKAIADLCGCTATELFGEWTNPELKAVEAAQKEST